MSIAFPSVEFFEALGHGLAGNPESTQDIEPSEAYCGIAIDDELYVLEFDGRECSAVVPGGNPLDLDFVLAAPQEVWEQTLTAIQNDGANDAERDLATLLDSGTLEVRSEMEDGQALARAALGILQAFFDQTKDADVRIG